VLALATTASFHSAPSCQQDHPRQAASAPRFLSATNQKGGKKTEQDDRWRSGEENEEEEHPVSNRLLQAGFISAATIKAGTPVGRDIKVEGNELILYRLTDIAGKD
jgi:hypothetical protein